MHSKESSFSIFMLTLSSYVYANKQQNSNDLLSDIEGFLEVLLKNSAFIGSSVLRTSFYLIDNGGNYWYSIVNMADQLDCMSFGLSEHDYFS